MYIDLQKKIVHLPRYGAQNANKKNIARGSRHVNI